VQHPPLPNAPGRFASNNIYPHSRPPRRNEASRERSSLGPRSLNWAQDARHSNIPGKSR
jgi:hypothetical protein